MAYRESALALLLWCAAHPAAASVYDAVLRCSGKATDWRTGSPVSVDLTVIPAERTDRPLSIGGVSGHENYPLTQGVGLGTVTWDDGVLGVRRDRALQLTQPGGHRSGYAPITMPLVILGFRAAPSGSIPLLLQIEVHREGLPFRAWLPGRSELLTGTCRAEPGAE